MRLCIALLLATGSALAAPRFAVPRLAPNLPPKPANNAEIVKLQDAVADAPGDPQALFDLAMIYTTLSLDAKRPNDAKQYLINAVKTFKVLSENTAFKSFSKRDVGLFAYAFLLEHAKYMRESRAVLEVLRRDHPTSRYAPFANAVFDDAKPNDWIAIGAVWVEIARAVSTSSSEAREAALAGVHAYKNALDIDTFKRPKKLSAIERALVDAFDVYAMQALDANLATFTEVGARTLLEALVALDRAGDAKHLADRLEAAPDFMASKPQLKADIELLRSRSHRR